MPLIKFHTKQKNGYWVDILRMAGNQILQLSGLENPTKQEGLKKRSYLPLGQLTVWVGGVGGRVSNRPVQGFHVVPKKRLPW